MANLEAGFLILNEWLPALRSLSGDECKELLFALVDRQQRGTPIPAFDGYMGVFAQMIEPVIQRRLDGHKGGKKGTSGGTAKVPTQVPPEAREEKIREDKSNTLSGERGNAHTPAREKKTRFEPPTLEDVRAYCVERGNSVDPERFIDHYTSNGWMVGKNPMKDWKAAVRNWEKSEGAFARQERVDGDSASDKSFLDVLKDA